jgi:protein involved in polysaccharide export with SLBB domain
MLALTLLANSAASQSPSEMVAQRATRTELTLKVAQLERALQDARLKTDARARTSAELQSIRNRLEHGDFRVGDRFIITMRRDTIRSDTASVRDSLKVAVFNLPDISLSGVLRSELDERMSAHVARYLRGVTVRTNVLTRVAVMGAVKSPGFLYVSPDRPVSDLIMLAGGPSPEANLKKLEVSRNGVPLVEAKDSDRILRDGRTLAQVDIQSGDEVRIPVKRKVSWQSIIQLTFVLSSLFFAALQFLMWYYGRKDG